MCRLLSVFLFAEAERDEELVHYRREVVCDGLINYCRFCPKCVSIGQNRMWQSTPKTNGKEKLEETWSSETLPGALSFPSAQHTDFT